MPVRRPPILAGLVLLALVLRLALLAADTHPYDEAGLAADSGNIAVNILAGRGIAENVTALQAIDARQTAQDRLIDPADIDPRSLPAPHYQPSVLEPPGEALVLAGIWKFTGNERYIYLQVLQAALDSLMVALVYVIALRLFRRRRAALIAAAGYAVFYPVAVLTRIPHLDIWAVFFTIAITACWTEAVERERSWWWLVLAATAAGIGVQFRPGVLLVPLLLAVASIAWRGGRWALRAGALSVLIMVLLMIPWTARNANVFHTFIPTRIGIGQNLWEGLGEVNNGFGAVLNDQVTLAQVHKLRPDLVYGTPGYDSYLEHKALTAIRQHPTVMLHAIARRAVVTTVDLHTLGWPWGLLEVLLFVLAVLVAVFTRHRFASQHLLLLAVPVATILPYLLLHVEPRYVLPASFVYLIWAGLGVDLAVAGELRHAPRSAAAA
jgi:4-amino-4-deoxy-L-arabinose transferase-like glycosyltransferase